SGKVPPGQINGNVGQSTVGEIFQFFYHPDHLGSTSYITDASGEVYQHLQYFPFGETFVEEHSNTWRTPYLFNGKELDEETGLYYYGVRYYDPITSVWASVDPMAEKYAGVSPYVYTLNNPIRYYDPDGRWIPGADKNNNVVITKEKGDTKRSLGKFMGKGYSKEKIKQLWKSMDKKIESINLTKELGGVFKEMTTAMTEAQARNNPTNADYNAVPKRLEGKNLSDNYNCYGACFALNNMEKLEGTGKDAQNVIPSNGFDSGLISDYKPTTRGDATVGKTVVRYADATNTARHSATFMGIDRSGNEYLFSKNGWNLQPEILTTGYIKTWMNIEFGTIRGIQGGESGYYNKK
ncbi:MAG: RHS repeat-associated core domain-containing protein, partial [Bacteroidetes bacterium]|nr:RHS repeat-associated core domain-containing protein [Bacteroidota bacterium]